MQSRVSAEVLIIENYHFLLSQPEQYFPLKLLRFGEALNNSAERNKVSRIIGDMALLTQCVKNAILLLHPE